MTTKAHEEGSNSGALRHVLVLVGGNALLYQDIEIALKMVLPYIRDPLEQASADPFADMKKLLASKGTMGPLIERLKGSIQSKDIAAIAAYLEQVVEDRNKLAHSFRRLPFGSLSTDVHCNEAVADLKERRAFALPLLALLQELLANLIAMLDVSAGGKIAQSRTLSYAIPMRSKSESESS